MLPLQALIKGRLALGVGGAFSASTISFIIAALAPLLIQPLLGKTVPTIAQITSVPVIYWIGGLLGAVYVTGAITSVGTLGPTVAICLIVAGQIFGAITVDYLGILSSTANAMSLTRVVGAMLVLAGAVLVVSSRIETTQAYGVA